MINGVDVSIYDEKWKRTHTILFSTVAWRSNAGEWWICDATSCDSKTMRSSNQEVCNDNDEVGFVLNIGAMEEKMEPSFGVDWVIGVK